MMVPRRREIFADGLPLGLGGRAFDVLGALIEADCAVVTGHQRVAARLGVSVDVRHKAGHDG
jgi:hypothetical protein